MSTKRHLGLSTATALVVANMIGTGVFTTSGFLLADLKSPWIVMAAWLVGGVVATFGAICYGALARRIPESGGEYLFLTKTVHPAAGYLAGWISLLVGFSAPLAAAAFGLGEYTKSWVPGLTPKTIGTVAILFFTLLHAGHVRIGARVQDLAVLVKVAAILLFIGYATQHLPASSPIPVAESFPWSTFAVSLVWVSFSYSGWNAAIYIAGEVEQPERNVPRALLIGALLVMVLYLGLNWVFVFSAPIEALAGKLEVGRIAGEALGGTFLKEAITVVIALALITSVSSLLMTGPRVYAKMAGDGYLPKFLAAGEKGPVTAIWLQCILALILLWSAKYDSLLTYIGFTLSLGTAATVIGLAKLRLKENLPVPGWPWIPGLFLAAVLWMAVFSVIRKPAASGVGLLTMAAGLVFYWLQKKGKRGGPKDR